MHYFHLQGNIFHLRESEIWILPFEIKSRHRHLSHKMDLQLRWAIQIILRQRKELNLKFRAPTRVLWVLSNQLEQKQLVAMNSQCQVKLSTKKTQNQTNLKKPTRTKQTKKIKNKTKKKGRSWNTLFCNFHWNSSFLTAKSECLKNNIRILWTFILCGSSWARSSWIVQI